MSNLLVNQVINEKIEDYELKISKEREKETEERYNELYYKLLKDYDELLKEYNELKKNYEILRRSFFRIQRINNRYTASLHVVKHTYIIDEYENKEYIYVIHEREFIRLKENTFKIGRTSHYDTRFKQYSKGSKLMFLMYCKNSKVAEKDIIQELKKTNDITHMQEYGNEYFKGNLIQIIYIINQIILNTSYDNLIRRQARRRKKEMK